MIHYFFYVFLLLSTFSCHLDTPQCPDYSEQPLPNVKTNFILGQSRYWVYLNTRDLSIDTIYTPSNVFEKQNLEYLPQNKDKRTVACPSIRTFQQSLYNRAGNLKFEITYFHDGTTVQNNRLNIDRYENNYKEYSYLWKYFLEQDSVAVISIKDPLQQFGVKQFRDMKIDNWTVKRLIKSWNGTQRDTIFFADSIGIVRYYQKGVQYNLIEFGKI